MLTKIVLRRSFAVAVLCASPALWSCASTTHAAVPADSGRSAEPIVVARAELSAATEEAFLRLYFPEDQLVETATRHPKSIAQIAENVTVVTAQEIEAMNAHTLAEVLNRVTGVFVDFWGRDFGGWADIEIQDSDNTHVSLLVDGVPINLRQNGASSTQLVPVAVIDRIEIIKGPASSTWGSSLGGVVNVITKGAGRQGQSGAQVSASYGEGASHDLRAELRGGLGPFGIYLQAGKAGSRGLRNDRDAAVTNLFAKLAVAPTEVWSAGFTLLSSSPAVDMGEQVIGQPSPFRFDAEQRSTLARLAVDVTPAPGWTMNLSAYRFDQTYDIGLDALDGSWTWAPVVDEHSLGANGQVTHQGGAHNVVLGIDYERTETLQDDYFGPSPDRELVGVYGNATLVWGDWAVTPGLRYDRDSGADPIWSPGLGATWQVHPSTLLRLSVARGFNSPKRAALAGDPEEESETIYSWQGGVETTAVPFLWLKATLFRHESKDAFVKSDATWEWRSGGELEAESAPFHGFSVRGGVGFVRTELPRAIADGSNLLHATANRYAWNLILRYLRGPFGAELAGHQVWWDEPDEVAAKGEYKDSIWKLNLRHTVLVRGRRAVELFGTVHNLFNGSQYLNANRPNPERWVEGGVRLSF